MSITLPPTDAAPAPVTSTPLSRLHGPGSGHGHAGPAAPGGRALALLVVAALGVVFGDLGTSPLYALKECFSGPHGITPTPANVLGVLSLVIWSLVLIVCVKYLVVVMRADNQGEGGVLSLLALTGARATSRRRGARWLLWLGLFGAALLYGDSIITPAISVLSAVEGLEVATPALQPIVVPVACVILVAIFAIQPFGSGVVGRFFGPVIALWFVAIGVIGAWAIGRAPSVLAAVNPMYGVEFFAHHGWHGVLILGTVILVVTGTEALYADMGHFGARSIRIAWWALVFPALLLNYFGQGATLLADPTTADNPFFRTAPTWSLVPLVVLATLASAIASQALIAAVFSLTRQAMQLGFSPRVLVKHTSSAAIGQIYLPGLNWALMVACLVLVVVAGSSTKLAAAYGLAMAGAMTITTGMVAAVMRRRWRWPIPVVLVVTTIFLLVDVAFLAANLLKLTHGGWLPLAMGAVAFAMMSTWSTGQRLLKARLHERAERLEDTVARIAADPDVRRIPGLAVYLTSDASVTPMSLAHAARHFRSLHATVAVCTVNTEPVPSIEEAHRVRLERVGPAEASAWRVTVQYGFMESPNIPAALAAAVAQGLPSGGAEAPLYVLGRETVLASARPGMWLPRERFYALLQRNARSAATFFRLPADQVVELGAQVEI